VQLVLRQCAISTVQRVLLLTVEIRMSGAGVSDNDVILEDDTNSPLSPPHTQINYFRSQFLACLKGNFPTNNKYKATFKIFVRVNNQLHHNSFSCMFTSILYVFQAAMCPSSGELIVSIRNLAYVTLKASE
jgi:hypothetical protein